MEEYRVTPLCWSENIFRPVCLRKIKSQGWKVISAADASTTRRRSLSSAAGHSGGLDGAFKGHPLRRDAHTSHPLQTDPSLSGTPASPPSCRARGQSEDPGGPHLPDSSHFLLETRGPLHPADSGAPPAERVRSLQYLA